MPKGGDALRRKKRKGCRKMADTRPIGVFDSGLGGLTAVKELLHILKNEDIVYFGDTGRVPYGSKSPETIKEYARQDENFLLSQDVKLIIAACGTVSSVAIETARDLPVKFIEVVTPASVAAVNATKNKKIGIIGTTATIKSNSYKNKILSLMPEAEVYQNDCPILVPLVEAGWIADDDLVTVETAKRYLEPLKSAGVDTLILGCTHYPVLKHIIGDIMGDGVTLINTGKQAALTAADYLRENDMLNDSRSSGKRSFFVTDRAEGFSEIASTLLGSDIGDSVCRITL